MKYPYLPLRDFVMVPGQRAVLFFGRKKSVKSIEYAIEHNTPVVVSVQTDPKIDLPSNKHISEIGVISEISRLTRLTDGTYKAVLQGIAVFQIKEFIDSDNYFVKGAKIEEHFNWHHKVPEVEALMRDIIHHFQIYAKLEQNINIDELMEIISVNDPFKLCYGIFSKLNVKPDKKQTVLLKRDIVEKLEYVFSQILSEIEILKVNKKIQAKVKDKISKTQKEYYLHEQLNAIQNELGYKSDTKSDLDDIENKLKNLKLPEYVKEKVEVEMKKLKSMHPASGETSIIRNYLEWIADLPWGVFTDDETNLLKVEESLNADHYGLENVKNRIVEYLAVKILSRSNNSPILCFVGPPGVGKTSLGKSIAKALNKNFIRMSLGGVKDEAEIRGHRRTYLGALPGKIIQGMKKAESLNPVFLLDEVDKISSDYRGDPASALLEVLDPEQNHTFNDHYLGIDFDLSNVMFIATANSLEGIPLPLRDRMEIIKIEGYTEFEKYEIARKHLLPKLMKETGLSEKISVKFSEKSILTIIRNYTREAGVRNLKRELEKIFRKIAKEVVKGKIDKKELHIAKNNVEKYLGIPKFRLAENSNINRIGITNGLAWTSAGGEILSVEVSVMKGNGSLTITGKLGEVMQESVKAALSYVRTRADILGLVNDFHKLVDFHIHVPEGAIPKDGPSAGITIVTSITSSLLNIPVRGDIAMTGEITLRGDLLPIGGLKEKLLAAKRSRIKNIIIPQKNYYELKEIPDIILNGLNIIPAETIDEVILFALMFPKAMKNSIKNDLSEFSVNKKLSKLILKDFGDNYAMLRH
jgi:ATP-dependent Lon protease